MESPVRLTNVSLSLIIIDFYSSLNYLLTDFLRQFWIRAKFYPIDYLGIECYDWSIVLRVSSIYVCIDPALNVFSNKPSQKTNRSGPFVHPLSKRILKERQCNVSPRTLSESTPKPGQPSPLPRARTDARIVINTTVDGFVLARILRDSEPLIKFVSGERTRSRWLDSPRLFSIPFRSISTEHAPSPSGMPSRSFFLSFFLAGRYVLRPPIGSGREISGEPGETRFVFCSRINRTGVEWLLGGRRGMISRGFPTGTIARILFSFQYGQATTRTRGAIQCNRGRGRWMLSGGRSRTRSTVHFVPRKRFYGGN